MNEFCSIKDDVKLGQGVKLSKFINLYGCSVGDNTKVGAFVEVQRTPTSGQLQNLQPHLYL